MDSTQRAALWTFVGIFVVFKVVTTAVIIMFAAQAPGTPSDSLSRFIGR